MKKCPFCAEEIQDEAIKCKHCGEMLSPSAPSSGGTNAPEIQTPFTAPTTPNPPNHTARNLTSGVILILLVGGFGLLHVVQTDTGVTVIPKEHFTFSTTFTSVSDVLERWNGRTLGTAMRGDRLFEHLVNELEQRGYISSRKKTWNEVGQDVRRSLPEK